jgi:hypothetical protein
VVAYNANLLHLLVTEFPLTFQQWRPNPRCGLRISFPQTNINVATAGAAQVFYVKGLARFAWQKA